MGLTHAAVGIEKVTDCTADVILPRVAHLFASEGAELGRCVYAHVIMISAGYSYKNADAVYRGFPISIKHKNKLPRVAHLFASEGAELGRYTLY
jgi:hypothetical protein